MTLLHGIGQFVGPAESATARRRVRENPGMGRLIFTLNVSLDGYVETPDRSLDWTTVDDELHSWFNDRARALDVSLYGRRLYELMAGYWPNAESDPDATGPMREFGRIWLATPKIVFSKTLDSVD